MNQKPKATSVKRNVMGDWIQLLKEDKNRYGISQGILSSIKTFIMEPGFRISSLMRTCAYTRANPYTRFGIYHFFRILYHLASTRYGVFIDFTTQIGGGLYLPHPCSIIVNRRTIIGRDCNLSQNNTLGISNRGPKKGCPTIGDRVYIGPGAVVFGGIHIGDDSSIGANAVVNSNVPSGTTFAGVPARQISEKGSEGYVNQCNSRSQRSADSDKEG